VPGPAHHFFSCSAKLLRTVFEEVVIKERKKRKGEEWKESEALSRKTQGNNQGVGTHIRGIYTYAFREQE